MAMNNTVLAKSINRMYYQLSQVVFHNTIDMTEMRRCINAVRADLDELKVLNEATREDKTAIVAT